jgi:Holliday junction DNA helicase RuvA
VIAKLTGVLDSVQNGACIVDVQGVGYLVQCSARTLRALSPVGSGVNLLIVTKMREDGIRLFGFLHESERFWFEILQNVQGVGSKVALSLLSSLSPDEVAQAIASGDKAALTRAEGLGAKLAQRLVNELKDKVGALPAGAMLGSNPGGEGDGVWDGAGRDAVSALVNLGYRAAQAEVAIAKAARKLGDGASAGDLIRTGLRELAR